MTAEVNYMHSRHLKYKRGIRTLTLTVVTSSYVGIIGLFGVPATVEASGCSGYGCDGRDPVQTGCSAGAYTATTGYAYRSGQPRFGDNGIVIELRYSPKCGTNWTRILFTGPAAPWVGVNIEVVRSNGAGINGPKPWPYTGRTQTLWGNMVYAPSPICARGYVEVDGWSYSWFGATPWAC
jgi:Protein of unknown function (DUF2690)